MDKYTAMNEQQLHFTVFCIEALADDIGTTGDKTYLMLSEQSDILDNYIVRCYDALHTQGRDYIVEDLKELLRDRGLL